MLPLQNRLKKRKDFEKVFRKGKGFSEYFFILKIRENELSFSRFAFVLPVKYEKKANKRNRRKRVFREVVRSILPQIKGGFDVVLIIKKEASKESYKKVKEELEKAFKKINLI